MKYVVIVTTVTVCITAAGFAFSSADFDRDGYVDVNDLVIFSTQWFTEPNAINNADFNGDNFVDFTDYAIFAAQWSHRPPLTISGTIGVDGVVMSGLPGDPVTANGGFYSAQVNYAWSGDVTPTKFGYNFGPPTRVYRRVEWDQTEQNYTSDPFKFIVSGNVGADGVTMVGFPQEVVSTGGGNYSAEVPYGWSGTVVPTLDGFAFNPSSRSYASVSSDWCYQDYAFTRPTNENCVRWPCDDNSENSIVGGSDIQGQLVDTFMGNNRTSSVSSIDKGVRALHLNGYSQYVRVTVPNIWPSALADKWEKYAGNPVIYNQTFNIKYGQVVKNPAGGYYWFGSSATSSVGDNIYRWSSDDMIHWMNKTLVLPSGGAGAWDKYCQVASAVCKPDGTWVMLYRGYDGSGEYHIGKAVSSDGTNWTRADTTYITQFARNFDPVGIMLVGDTYYLWINGDPGHGIQNLYTTKDFETFTRYSGSPIFNSWQPYDFCASPWYYSGYFYLLVSEDFNASGSALNDHAFALYRSTSPTFDPWNRDFLGYPIVNDKSYDSHYLDTPSVPVMDATRTYSTEFGNTLYCLYDGHGGHMPYGNTQNLAYTTLDKLVSLKPKLSNLTDGRVTYSFWVNFDRLTTGSVLFSVGRSSTDTAPVELCRVGSNGGRKVISLYLGGASQYGCTLLDVNVPYHVVVVDDARTTKLYINGVPDGLITTKRPLGVDDNYIYIGAGYGGCLPGYVWDFRIYPQPLGDDDVDRLYRTGTIVDPNATN